MYQNSLTKKDGFSPTCPLSTGESTAPFVRYTKVWVQKLWSAGRWTFYSDLVGRRLKEDFINTVALLLCGDSLDERERTTLLFNMAVVRRKGKGTRTYGAQTWAPCTGKQGVPSVGKRGAANPTPKTQPHQAGRRQWQWTCSPTHCYCCQSERETAA